MESSNPGMLEEFQIFEKKSTSISHLAKIGVLNKKSDLYRKKCMQSNLFPFSIALRAPSSTCSRDKSDCFTSTTSLSAKSASTSTRANEGAARIELISTSYEILKEWVMGINMLMNK
jgi:hypothetical protein